jgi:hypothetical protein
MRTTLGSHEGYRGQNGWQDMQLEELLSDAEGPSISTTRTVQVCGESFHMTLTGVQCMLGSFSEANR